MANVNEREGIKVGGGVGHRGWRTHRIKREPIYQVWGWPRIKDAGRLATILYLEQPGLRCQDHFVFAFFCCLKIKILGRERPRQGGGGRLLTNKAPSHARERKYFSLPSIPKKRQSLRLSHRQDYIQMGREDPWKEMGTEWAGKKIKCSLLWILPTNNQFINEFMLSSWIYSGKCQSLLSNDNLPIPFGQIWS